MSACEPVVTMVGVFSMFLCEPLKAPRSIGCQQESACHSATDNGDELGLSQGLRISGQA